MMVKVCIAVTNGITDDVANAAHGLEHKVKCLYQVAQGTDRGTLYDILVDPKQSTEVFRDIDGDISHFVLLSGDIAGITSSMIIDMLSMPHDIVSMSYKSPMHNTYTCGMWEQDKPGVIGEAFKLDTVPGTYKVDWVHFGCAVLTRRALETVESPWFSPKILRWTEARQGLDKPINHAMATSSDTGYCVMAQAYGYKLWTYIPDTPVTYLWPKASLSNVVSTIKMSDANTPAPHG